MFVSSELKVKLSAAEGANCEMKPAVTCLLLACLLYPSVAVVPVQPGMKSFSSAIKGGTLDGNQEKVLYEHDTGHPGVITEQWFTGVKVMDQDTRIRIYIDMETEPSLDFQLFLAHGIGFNETEESSNIPWGTRRLAHSADGGIYNTYRIPFSKGFKVTATRPTTGAFWYIVRGVENYPLILGDLQLPSNTRLRLYKNEKVTLQPLEFVTLANISSSAGAVFMVTLAAQSTDYNYLEACMRAHIDGSEQTTWLSSGTEDFFLSAYYFNKGIYHLDNAGLTYKDSKGSMSAYKFFENDPLLFSKSFTLVWRCGESINGKDGCPNNWPPPNSTMENTYEVPKLAPTTVTTYTWVYQW